MNFLLKLKQTCSLLCLTLLILQGCRECEPETYPNNQAILSVLNLTDESTAQISFGHIFGEINGLQGDSIMQQGNSTYSLPLKTDESITAFVFKVRGLEDTLYLTYGEKILVNGPDCGAFEVFNDLKALVGSDRSTAVINYKFQENGLFDSLSIIDATLSGDTLNPNVSVFLNNCDPNSIVPSRTISVHFFDSEGNSITTSFKRIYRTDLILDPFWTSDDGSTSSVEMTISGDSTSSFVFEKTDIEGNTLVDTIKFHFSNEVVISDDNEGCLLYNGTGDLKMENPEGEKVTELENGNIFSRAEINRNVLNSDKSLENANVKLFL